MITEKTAGRKGRRGDFSPMARISSCAALVRRLLASVLVALFVISAFGDLCVGWSADAAERAACCARMENHCASWSPDDCCGNGEQRRTRDLVRAVPLPTPDMTPGPVVTPLVAVDDDISLQVSAARPHAHLLHAVFLI